MYKKFYNTRASFFTILLAFLVGQATAAGLGDVVEKNPRQALVQIKSSLEKDANDQNALFLRAKAYENLGRIEVAKRQYESFIERFPTRPEAYLNLANIYSKKLSDQASVPSFRLSLPSRRLDSKRSSSLLSSCSRRSLPLRVST